MEKVKIFSQFNCELGEGCLWHHLRKSWFWFDITKKKIIEKKTEKSQEIIREFNWCISAAGIIDTNHLLISSEKGLHILDLNQNSWKELELIEADNPYTRSNDGRAHPSGAFWWGTMGKKSEKNQGSIYHFHEGKVTKLYSEISIPNSICFSPQGDIAFFSDTPTHKIMKVKVNLSNGLPIENPKIFSQQFKNPDGSIVDNQNNLFCAHWGSRQVVVYSQQGKKIAVFNLLPKQVSCPALGGLKLNELLVTSSSLGLSQDELTQNTTHAGKTFILETSYTGIKEPVVKI